MAGRKYYVLPLNSEEIEYTCKVIRVVNHILDLGADVWWLQKKLNGQERIYSEGDFVVSLSSEETIENKILVNYFLKMVQELGVAVYLEQELDKSILTTIAHKLIKPKVAVYYGNGTTDGALWFIQVLESMGFDIGIVTENDITNGLLEDYNVLILGSGMNYCSYLGKEGCKRVEEFVYSGGGYIGHCGGAVAAVKGYPKSRDSSWLELADVRLELKEDGSPLSSYARGMVTYNITMPNHPVMFGYKGNISLSYWWGPIFSSKVGKGVSVLATILRPTPEIQKPNPEITRVDGIKPSVEELINSAGKPAILSADYGKGKVVLFSPHPESPDSKDSFRVVANEIFYVTSFSESPREIKVPNIDTKGELNDRLNREKLEEMWEEINSAEGMIRAFMDKDLMVCGSIGESTLSYLNDSAERMKKIKGFKPSQLAFGSTPTEYLCNRIDDAVKKQAVAIDKINDLTETETMRSVQKMKTFLMEHRKTVNDILNLRNNLNGKVTDEYANLVKKASSSHKDALNEYKYRVEAKILEASFAITRAERAIDLIAVVRDSMSDASD